VATENVELHRRIYAALNAGDTDALLAILDRNVEIRSVFAAIGGAVYHGHEGGRKWQADLRDAFGRNFRVEIDTYFDLGESTLCFGTLQGRGEQSEAEVAMPAAGVARWRDGRCVSHKAYADKEEALRELGISEAGLEPIAEPDENLA
jgi:ketosteroid isomerase-like protein